MSSLSEDWRILPFGNRKDGPPKLLFKFITSSDAYELYVTDLLNCWNDCRSRVSITEEAARTRSSIDPSEDASQFDVLLGKLRDGLMGRNGARCKIGSIQPDTSAPECLNGFRICSRIPLPPPLQPLFWTFELVQKDRMLLTREVVLPALASDLKHQTQIKDLNKRIEEKDHVITRLMDKIEQLSMDLSLVFPGYGIGRKGLNAKQATKVVPGISKFNQAAWQKDFTDNALASTRSLAEAFRKSGTDILSFESPRDRYGEITCWEPFGKAANYSKYWMDDKDQEPVFTEDDGSREEQGGHRIKDNLDRKLNGDTFVPGLSIEESSEAFEDVTTVEKISNQNTIAAGAPHRPPSPRPEQTSSSDDSPSPVGRSQFTKVGKLGGSRSQTPPNRRTSRRSSVSGSDSPPLAEKPKKSSKLGILGGRKKASQAAASPQSPSPSPVASNHSTPPRKLGTLGGKKYRIQPSPSSAPPAPRPGYSISAPTPSRELGVLGDRHKPATPQKAESTSKATFQHHMHNDDLDATDSPSPSPSPSAPHQPYPSIQDKEPEVKSRLEPEKEPDTAEEIADRKREELKRTLDAGGEKKKKKKRKF